MKNDREKELEEEILDHKRRYYSGQAIISDDKFDLLEEELRKINPENFVLLTVGSVASASAKIPHETKMLSLEKTYLLEDLEKWMGKNDLLSIFKIDGVSCSLIYKDGQLITGKTRGDGSVGEEITEKCRWITDIPKVIEKSVGQLEVRGEIFCTEENFIKLAEMMEMRGLPRPMSLRNIVAGLISRKDYIDLSSFLSFNGFDLIANLPMRSEYHKLELLKKMGFKLPDYEIHKNFKSVEQFIKKAATFIEEGEYQIDGVVFVVDSIEMQNSLGVTAHHPRYKMAFKFKGESKEATILGIDWSVSRNGFLTPVARVTKTELSGATVENVTLHNWGMVKQFNLKKDDKILIIRSGEVIPKFLEVISSAKGETSYPRVCPSCGSETCEKDIRLVCKNHECSGKNKAIILNYIQKIGIEDLSEKRLEEMIKKKIVKEIPDLYKIKTSDLLQLDKTKEKMANKLFANIQATKEIDLITFLSAIGISGGAFNKCQKVVQAGYDTINKILDLSLEDLMSIESFAEKSSKDFLFSLQGKNEIIKELLYLGMKFIPPRQDSQILQGKSFCITGSLSEKREVVEDKIRQNGGKVLSSVTKGLHFLICNELGLSSSKLEKATKLGVEIINEENLKQYLLNGIGQDSKKDKR